MFSSLCVQSVWSWRRRMEASQTVMAASSLWGCRAKTETLLRSSLCTEFVLPPPPCFSQQGVNADDVMTPSVCSSGGAAEVSLLPVRVQDVQQGSEESALPFRRLQSDGQPDAGAARHGGRWHHRSLGLSRPLQLCGLLKRHCDHFRGHFILTDKMAAKSKRTNQVFNLSVSTLKPLPVFVFECYFYESQIKAKQADLTLFPWLRSWWKTSTCTGKNMYCK